MAFEIKYIVYIENIPLVKGYRENVTVFSRKCNFFRRFEQNYQNLCKKKRSKFVIVQTTRLCLDTSVFGPLI